MTKAYLVGYMEFNKETNNFNIYHFDIYGGPSYSLTQVSKDILFDILESGEHEDYLSAKNWIKEYTKEMSKYSQGWAFIHKEITKYDDEKTFNISI